MWDDVGRFSGSCVADVMTASAALLRVEFLVHEPTDDAAVAVAEETEMAKAVEAVRSTLVGADIRCR